VEPVSLGKRASLDPIDFKKRPCRMPFVVLSKLRPWWFARQGLSTRDETQSPAQVLERTGWSRSVGGASPYLGLFARSGIQRKQADQAIENLEIQELPSARGCTYVLPACDFALGLRVGQGFSDESAMRTARNHLGVTEEEIRRLQDRVLEVLQGGSREPKALKEAVGDASRNLGEAGKKRGQTTTLPLALGFLQSQGRIRRVPVNGRLDQQRYAYTIWDPSPLSNFLIPREEAFADLARRYFRWIGLAQVSHFQWFSGLGVKAAKEAVAMAGAVPFHDGSEWLCLPEDRAEFEAFEVPKEPVFRLVSGLDSLFLLRRDLPNLVDESDKARSMVGEKGPQSVGGGLQDLSNHAILDRGRLVGIWEYDSFAQEIVWVSFVGKPEALTTEVGRTETFIREQLGDCRTFSLDSPESRKPVIQALRSMAI